MDLHRRALHVERWMSVFTAMNSTWMIPASIIV